MKKYEIMQEIEHIYILLIYVCFIYKNYYRIIELFQYIKYNLKLISKTKNIKIYKKCICFN